VYSISLPSSVTIFSFLQKLSFKNIFTEGVLIDFETFIISFILGTPKVTFFAETPAKWNVFNVI